MGDSFVMSIGSTVSGDKKKAYGPNGMGVEPDQFQFNGSPISLAQVGLSQPPPPNQQQAATVQSLQDQATNLGKKKDNRTAVATSGGLMSQSSPASSVLL